MYTDVVRTKSQKGILVSIGTYKEQSEFYTFYIVIWYVGIEYSVSLIWWESMFFILFFYHYFHKYDLYGT